MFDASALKGSGMPSMEGLSPVAIPWRQVITPAFIDAGAADAAVQP
jgi:hypothetical protein